MIAVRESVNLFAKENSFHFYSEVLGYCPNSVIHDIHDTKKISLVDRMCFVKCS